MEYLDANYLDTDGKTVRNRFDDKEAELKEQYRTGLKEWKQELIGNRQIAIMLNEKIVEAWNNLAEERAYLNGLYARSTILTGDASEWNTWGIRRSTERKEQLEKILNSWQYKKDFYAGKIKDDRAPLDIEQAKNAPVEEIIGCKGEKRGDKLWFKCPVKTEKTPSFVWDIKKRRGTCYGCGWFGDAVDLFQALNNCSFVDAVKHLVKY